ncbi:hypothetical protein [Jannaschia marina]|uniref:hypothetical protein n=1 Tax=Jannaschia marina TaxID=2741674 RepID=UPI0015CC43E0|nr:hypothetical protein [Jannaschia marina]
MFAPFKPFDLPHLTGPAFDTPAMLGTRRLPGSAALAVLDDRLLSDIGLAADTPLEPAPVWAPVAATRHD